MRQRAQARHALTASVPWQDGRPAVGAACASSPPCRIHSPSRPSLPTAPVATKAPEKEITIASSGFATSNDFWNTLGKAARALGRKVKIDLVPA